jgi:hypothetical protein
MNRHKLSTLFALGILASATHSTSTAAVLEELGGASIQQVVGLPRVDSVIRSPSSASEAALSNSITVPVANRLGATDQSTVSSFAGAAGDHRYTVGIEAYGHSFSIGQASKSLKYLATEAGTLSVNSFLDAGSLGANRPDAATSESVLSNYLFVGWVLSSSPNLVRGHDFSVYSQMLRNNVSETRVYSSDNTTLNGTTYGALNTVSYNWAAMSFNDQIHLNAGESVNVIFDISSRAQNFVVNNAACVNDVLGHNSCASAWVNNGDGASFDFTFTADSVTAVPEPAEWALMLAGMGLVARLRRKTAGMITPSS